MDNMRNFIISKINKMNELSGTILEGYDPFYDSNEGLLSTYDACRTQFKLHAEYEKKALLEKYNLEECDAISVVDNGTENNVRKLSLNVDGDKMLNFRNKIKETMSPEDFELYSNLSTL